MSEQNVPEEEPRRLYVSEFGTEYYLTDKEAEARNLQVAYVFLVLFSIIVVFGIYVLWLYVSRYFGWNI